MQPKAAGTVIQKKTSTKGVKAIAAKDGIIAINIKSSRMLLAYGFLRKIFEVFEKYKTPIDMVTTSEVAVSVTIDNGSHLPQILRELEPFGTTEVETEQTIVSIVGNEIVETKDVLSKIFEGLANVPVRMVSYGGSKHNVSVLIPSSFKNQTLQKLNLELFGLE
jgi:aspartate kinase